MLDTLKIKEYVIYMQDFGAPVGFRVMMHDPARVKAIIAQNANAYLEGISQARQDFFIKAKLDKSPENVAKYGQILVRNPLKTFSISVMSKAVRRL